MKTDRETSKTHWLGKLAVTVLAVCCSVGNASTELSDQFRTTVSELSSDELRFHSQKFSSKIHYLVNSAEVDRRYILGVQAERNPEVVLPTLNDFQSVNGQLDLLFKGQQLEQTSIKQCAHYFESAQQGYERLLDIAQQLLDDPTYGVHSLLGYSGQHAPIPLAEPSRESLKLAVHFEILSKSLMSQSVFFLFDQESYSPVMQTQAGACELENRAEIKRLFGVRLRIVQALQLQLVGERGFYDVAPFTEQFHPFFLNARRKLRMKIAVGVGLMVASVVSYGYAAPYAAAYLASLPVGSAKFAIAVQAGVFSWAIVTTGQQSLSAIRDLNDLTRLDLSKVAGSSKTASDNLLGILELPEDDYKFGRMLRDYEEELYQLKVSNDPITKSKQWLLEGVRVYGSEEALLEQYRAKFDFINEELTSRDEIISNAPDTFSLD